MRDRALREDKRLVVATDEEKAERHHAIPYDAHAQVCALLRNFVEALAIS